MKTIAQQLNVTEFPFTIKDKNGKMIYYENLNGVWVKSKYDSNGNRIHTEISDGFWEEWKFDSNGNVIYYENSNGFWWKSEYDSDEICIYYENSNGYVKDDRPKPCEGKLVEIEGIKYKLVKA